MANRYWRTSSGTWTTTSSWAATDGGAPGVPVPTDADDVYFTDLSLPSGAVTVSLPSTASIRCRHFYFTRTVGSVTIRKTSTSFSNWYVQGDFVVTGTGITWSLLSINANLQINFENASGLTSRSLRCVSSFTGNTPFLYFNCPGVTYTLTGDFAQVNSQQFCQLNQGTISFSNFYFYAATMYLPYNSNSNGLTFGGSGGMRLAGPNNVSSQPVFGNDSTGNLTVSGTPNIQYYRTTAFVNPCTFGASNSTSMSEVAKTPLKFVATSAGTAYGLVFSTSYLWNGGLDFSGWIRGQYPILTGGAYPYVAGNTHLGNDMLQAGQSVSFVVPDNGTATLAASGSINGMVYMSNQTFGRSTFNGTVTLASNITFANNNYLYMQRGYFNMNGFTYSARWFAAYNDATYNGGITGSGTMTLRATELTGSNIFYVDYASRFTFPTGVVISIAGSNGGNYLTYGGSSLASPTNTNTPNLTLSGAITSVSATGAWRNINMSGVTSGGFALGGTAVLMGDLTLSSTAGVNLGGSTTIEVRGNGTQTITGNGRTASPPFLLNGSGTVNFASGWVGTGALTHTSGTINFGAGTTFTLASFTSSGGTARTVNLNSATLNMTGSFDVSAGGITFTGTSATINMGAAGTFAGGSRSYGTVRLSTTGNVSVTGANTITTLDINANGTLTLPASTTTTVTNFTTTNSAGQATLQSSSAGTQASLSKASGTVNVSNLRIQDSNATGGATFFAYTINNNTNLGNNTNWIFSSYTPSNQFFPFS